ncbi:MAG: OsmC family protein [Ignavibacteriales bacterium]|nr:OsmC family protein [Ignavibacteriales bacterium]MBI3787480.1 OsmC family protein [Ignavibacteriales bacterium]
MAKEVFLKQVQGVTFAAKGNSNHWVVMDGSPQFGGSQAGSSPKELLLMALAGCTSNDVVPILKKKRVPLQGYEVRVTGNEREENPKIFTDIHVEYIFYGENINPADIERAIELSTTKYCSVSAIVGATAKITHSYRIESPVKETVETAATI